MSDAGRSETDWLAEVCPRHGIRDCSPLLNACTWAPPIQALKVAIQTARRAGDQDRADDLWDVLDHALTVRRDAAADASPAPSRSVLRRMERSKPDDASGQTHDTP